MSSADSMHRILTSLAMAFAFCGTSFASDVPPDVKATAAPSTFLDRVYVHVGPAGVIPDAGARIKVRGAKLQGADIAMPATVTAALEIGYRLTPNWAVSLSTGVPRTTVVQGKGTIASFGKLATSLAGPMAVTAHYHFLQLGAFQPYIGGGAAYLVVFNSNDAALSRFRLAEAFGAVGQVGADIMITDHIGVFVDVKKAYLRTTSRGFMGGQLVKADVKLDPLALTGGVTFRF